MLGADRVQPLKCADKTPQRGHACGNELLIPEGERAGEITLIWTLLLWLIFVMQSYSMATMHRWL